MTEEKTKEKENTNTDLIYRLDIDQKTQRCTDKIEVISLIHGTGQIKLITKNGKQIDKITQKDLINELNTEHDKNIIKTQRNLFEDRLIIKYCKNREGELNKIFDKANLFFGKFEKDELGFKRAIVFVNNLTPLERIEMVINH